MEGALGPHYSVGPFASGPRKLCDLKTNITRQGKGFLGFLVLRHIGDALHAGRVGGARWVVEKRRSHRWPDILEPQVYVDKLRAAPCF